MDAGSPQARQVLELLNAICDGRGSEESHAQLDELLRENGDAADVVVAFSWLHSDLCRESSAFRAEQAVQEALRPPCAAGSKYASVAVPAEPVARSESRLRYTARLALSAVAAAASLYIAFVTVTRPVRRPEPQPRVVVQPRKAKIESVRLVRSPVQIGCVTHIDGAKWASGVQRTTGALLSQGEVLELLHGSAQVSMSCGADLVLQAPCRVVLEEPMAVRLEKGTMTTEVAPWAQGFVVETGGLRVTDLGTRFAVSAESSSIAEVHVLEGKVIAEPKRDREIASQGITLNMGQAMRVNRTGETVERLAAEGRRFIDRLNDFRPLRPIVMANTGYGLKIGDNDPHWTITAGEGPARQWPIPAVVGPADEIYLDNFPDASQWVSVPQGTIAGVLPNTSHTFETTFDLTGFDLSTVSIIGQFLADNGVTEMRLNGKPIDIVPWEERVGDCDFQNFHVVRVSEGFVQGKNRLAVDVINTSWGGDRAALPTPMGLRVEWQAFGRPLIPAADPLKSATLPR